MAWALDRRAGGGGGREAGAALALTVVVFVALNCLALVFVMAVVVFEPGLLLLFVVGSRQEWVLVWRRLWSMSYCYS